MSQRSGGGTQVAAPRVPLPHQRPRLKPAPLWWRDAAGIAAWTSMLLVVALWLSGGGLGGLVKGPAEALTSLGRLTGLVAADLLVIQVLLMARVPWIERSYGQDELARRHRLVGFWSFNLLTAHVILITLGYTLSDHNDVVHEGWNILRTYAGMLLAAAGTLALTMVTITSIRAARRVLRYESWHLLHLYAYVGIALTIPHEIWTGADFTRMSSAATAWWVLNVAAAVIVVIFRVALPVARTLRHSLVVSAVVRESDDVFTVEMTGRRLDRLQARAGQFFIWRFLDGPGWSRGNPYSLSSAPSPDRLQITVKDLGDGSQRLASLKPGTRAIIEGPFGRLTADSRSRNKVTMIACGIGITPMHALLEELHYAPGDATLVYRARSHEDLIFRNQLESLATRRGVRVHYVLGTRMRARHSWLPAKAARWHDHDALLEMVPDLVDSDVFVCGPSHWMDAVTDACDNAGLPRQQLHTERFAW